MLVYLTPSQVSYSSHYKATKRKLLVQPQAPHKLVMIIKEKISLQTTKFIQTNNIRAISHKEVRESDWHPCVLLLKSFSSTNAILCQRSSPRSQWSSEPNSCIPRLNWAMVLSRSRDIEDKAVLAWIVHRRGSSVVLADQIRSDPPIKRSTSAETALPFAICHLLLLL